MDSITIERMKLLREKHKLKQKEIGELLNVTATSYTRYEKGRREINISILTTLAKFYNVSADYLLGLIDEPTPLYPNKQNQKK